jgi:ApaG protein
MEHTPPLVKCLVQTKYVEDQSEPEQNRYVFAYMITIKNLSSQPIQLLSRRWLITDANGRQMSVEGDGVVGQQPVIAANDDYTYSSGTVIETPVGVMQGQYIMLDEHNKQFNAEIDPFRLAVPNILN